MMPDAAVLGHLLHLNINVTDLGRSVTFYERLGFRAIARFAYSSAEAAPPYAAFGIEPMAFKGALMQLADEPVAGCFDLVQWDRPVERTAAPANAIGPSRLRLAISDAGAMLARLAQWDLPLLGPPCRLTVSESEAYELFCFRDPDGTCWKSWDKANRRLSAARDADSGQVAPWNRY